MCSVLVELTVFNPFAFSFLVFQCNFKLDKYWILYFYLFVFNKYAVCGMLYVQ